METAIESAIKLLAEKITGDIKSDDALKFTQAALNLAHVEATLAGARHLESSKK
jgi:hypothetical protein